MRRRDFITGIAGSTVAWPLAALAQQAMPVIGFLHSGSAAVAFEGQLVAFREGLKEGGASDGYRPVVLGTPSPALASLTGES
jgi:putative ABC transport system substrate-binding protein